MSASFFRLCETCDGGNGPRYVDSDWHGPRGREPFDQDAYSMHSSEAEGMGSECEDCNATGRQPDPEGDPEDGDTIPCETCDGEGRVLDTCGACHCSFDDEAVYSPSDSGMLICEDCAEKDGAFECPDCDGSGRFVIESVTLKPRDANVLGPLHLTFPVTGASCACCGARPHNPGDRDINGYKCDDTWLVVNAPMCDSDGIYFPRLCSNADGTEGCLIETLRQQADVPEERAKRLSDLLEILPGEESDGIVSEMGE